MIQMFFMLQTLKGDVQADPSAVIRMKNGYTDTVDRGLPVQTRNLTAQEARWHQSNGPAGDGDSRNHMRRSSLGSGRGRRGFSGPAAPVCFLSSALGLYVPSIRRFFLMRHRSSSRAKLSSDSKAGELHACIAMVTRNWRGKTAHESGPLSHRYIKKAAVCKLKRMTAMENPDNGWIHFHPFD